MLQTLGVGFSARAQGAIRPQISVRRGDQPATRNLDVTHELTPSAGRFLCRWAARVTLVDKNQRQFSPLYLLLKGSLIEKPSHFASFYVAFWKRTPAHD